VTVWYAGPEKVRQVGYFQEFIVFYFRSYHIGMSDLFDPSHFLAQVFYTLWCILK